MVWVILCAWIAGATTIGYPIALSVFRVEKRSGVLLPFAILAGHCIQMLVMAFAWTFVPPGPALVAAIIVSLGVGAVSIARSRGPFGPLLSPRGVPRLDTALTLAFAASFGYLGYFNFTMAYLSLDAEALFQRAGFTAWLTRGLFPPTNPLDPSDQLHYRFGMNLLAAGFSSASGEAATVSTAVVLSLLLALMAIAFAGASCSLFGSTGPGIVAALLGLFGGSLLPYLRIAEYLFHGANLRSYAAEFWSGLLWGGNTLDMLRINATVAAEFAMFAVALWLAYEAWLAPTGSRGWMSLLVSVVALAGLGLYSDVYLIALAGALLLVSARNCWQDWKTSHRTMAWTRARQTLLVVGVALAIVKSRGGLMGGMALTGETGRSAGLALNLDHLGSVIVPVNMRVTGWMPVLSVDAIVDTDLILLGLPLLLIMAWRSRNSYALVGLAAAAISMVAWLAIYPRQYPESAYHFGQAALMSYVALAPLTLATSLKALSARSKRFVGPALAILAILLTATSFSYQLWLTGYPMSAFQGVPGSSDVAACEVLKQSRETSRVLVPTDQPERGSEVLYLPTGPGKSIREVVGLGFHSVPLGWSPDFKNATKTADLYSEASLEFDEDTLRALGVDWVYVLPTYLSTKQHHNLESAVSEKRLVLSNSFGESGAESERWLFRVRQVPR